MPSVKALALTPQTASVAPLEQLQFAAKNGTKPYTFVITANGSGGATVDPKTGAYRAGPTGPAADVVRVTDASGLAATARVTVGPRLVVTPAIAFAAPGGKVVLAPTGGKPPYQVTAARNASNGSLEADGLTWDVGTTGDVLDLLDVVDAVGARVEVQVQVGQVLALLPTRDPTVAPRETLAFVATGGQAPYTFSIATAGSAPASGTQGDAPSIAASGMYQAGSTGDATDTVEVTDANGETATVDVSVTAALTAAFEGPALHPGQPIRVVAKGGRPPYAFCFADRGNRSGGTVDPITGIYTPGWSYGVRDRVEVADSVGVVADVAPATIGNVVLPAAWMDQGVFVDLRGDGYDDLLIRGPYTTGSQGQQHLFSMRAGAAPTERSLTLTGGVLQFLGPRGMDVNGDGLPDVAAQDWQLALSVWVTGVDGLPRTRIPVGSPSSSGADAALLPAGGEAFFVADASCPGVARIDLPAGSTVPTAPTCVPIPTSVLGLDWRAAYVDGDDVPDLVWLHDGDSKLYVSHGPTYADAVAYTLPGPAVANARLAVVRLGGSPASSQEQDVLALVTVSGQTAVTGLSGGQVISALAIPASVGAPPDQLVAVPSVGGDAGSVVAWNPVVGHLVSAGRDAGGYWMNTSAGTLPAGQFDRMAAGDANGDRVADLAAFGFSVGRTVVLWGDGHGHYGGRPRIGPVDGTNISLGDVDGDGLDDVVTLEGSQLAVLHGDPGQAPGGVERGLAWAPPVDPALPGGPASVVDVTGDGRGELIYTEQGSGLWSVGLDPSGAFSVVTQLPVPASASPEAASSVEGADLGGDAPGRDLMMYRPTPSGLDDVTGLVRDTSGITAVPVPALPASTAGAVLPYDADGDGLSDAVAECITFNTAGMPEATILVSTAQTTGGKVTSFGSWVAPGGNAYPDVDFPIAAGEVGGVIGYFARGTRPPGTTGNLLFLSNGTITRRTLSYTLVAGLLADVDGDGLADFVLIDTEGGVHVIRNAVNPASADVVTTHVGRGRLLGAVHLQPGAAPDVLVELGSDLVVLKNDGSGNLQ